MKYQVVVLIHLVLLRISISQHRVERPLRTLAGCLFLEVESQCCIAVDIRVALFLSSNEITVT